MNSTQCVIYISYDVEMFFSPIIVTATRHFNKRANILPLSQTVSDLDLMYENQNNHQIKGKLLKTYQ